MPSLPRWASSRSSSGFLLGGFGAGDRGEAARGAGLAARAEIAGQIPVAKGSIPRGLRARGPGSRSGCGPTRSRRSRSMRRSRTATGEVGLRQSCEPIRRRSGGRRRRCRRIVHFPVPRPAEALSSVRADAIRPHGGVTGRLNRDRGPVARRRHPRRKPAPAWPARGRRRLPRRGARR